MIEKLDALGAQALQEIEKCTDRDALEQIRIQVLGKKGSLSEVLKGLGHVSAEDRPKIGAKANEWKQKIEAILEGKKTAFESAALNAKIAKERVDVTLPSRLPHAGSLHIITQTTRKLVQIFSRIGFDIATGPEADTEFYNFEAVNIPKDHPARDMQDTFYVSPGVVLRSQTSSVQMRAMQSQDWPLRIVCPGAVYRADNDATHTPMFHQLEGLWVDRNVSMADLKGTLQFFAAELFGSETKIRLRPSYFPFVEPGAEVDVSCFKCKGTGTLAAETCRLCKGSGWIEILGAGMVHPRLFEIAGYTGAPTGFAFGLGIERIAMLLHHVHDLRLMFQGDVRFLNQFRA